MEFQPGSTIGDYEVVAILGEGGMGKVYKVRNVISDRIEAMKVLLPDLANTSELADRFLREIKVLASLQHPNIAQLHTAVRADNQLLMVMEFVDGETLQHRLGKGPVALPQALDYISQVLSALEFAHARGVVHRDIKPANMMVTTQGAIKLMDFGIAKAATDPKLTVTGTTMGSVYYMSPEQVQGAATLDARADLYSVGVTLYELATGKRPFDGGSQYAIMAAHLEKTPAPPITLDPGLPQTLNDVILMSVAKDPNTRFQSAAAFRNALMAVAGELKAATVPASAPAAPAAPVVAAAQVSAPRPASKRWLWMTIGAVAACAAVVCAIELAPRKPTHAAAPAEQTSSVPAPQTAAPPPSETPAPAPAAQDAPASVTPPASQTPAPQPSAPAPVTPAPRDKTPRTAVAKAVPQQSVEAPVSAAAPPQVSRQAPAASAAPAAAAPVVSGPSRAEVSEVRQRLDQLDVRASAIQDSLANLRSSMQAQGLDLNARFTKPKGLMDNYLRSAAEALQQSDLAAARDSAAKAERQIAILEKLLNL